MKELNDNELDMLISQSLQRQKLFERVYNKALAEAKRHNRRVLAKRVLRLVVVAFGLPIMLAAMSYGAYRLVMMDGGVFSYVAAAIAIISAVTMTTYSLANFSFDEV